MVSFFKKKNADARFEIDSPNISIKSTAGDLVALLKMAGVEYKIVTDGYVIFTGYVFDSDIPLMIGIHFNWTEVKYIEIFRTTEYFQSREYDIKDSFSELSKILQKKYGMPLVTTSASIDGCPCEQWITPNYVVNHYITDRVGPEEHLHINFYKK